MNRFPHEIFLPQPEEADNDLYRALSNAFRDVSIITREIQAPPMLCVDMNNVDQAITVNVPTTLALTKARTDAIDTHGWFDNTTHRYTPKEAGYYQCSVHITLEYLTSGLVAAGNIRTGLSKNNTNEATLRLDPEATGTIRRTLATSKVLYLNGNTDYIYAFCTYDSGTALSVLGAFARTYLSATFLGGPQVP